MRIIKILCVVLALCFVLTGCTFMEDVSNVLQSRKIVEKVENSAYFGFSNGELLKEDKEEYIAADFFDGYTSNYRHLRSDIYYNALSVEEQQVYLALEYALENSFSNVLVDSQLVDSADDIIKVAEYLSLDTPLLEQNLRFEGGTFTSYIPVKITDFYSEKANFDGYYLTIYNFSADMFNKKLLAVEAVEDVIKSLPENMTEFEKAEHLYKILAQNVEYAVYEDDDGKTSVYPYLYDALVEGKTQCDGFANALSLLYRLAGIEAAEKQFSSEDEIGHTWTAFEIDGKWYNADAANNSLIPKTDCSLKGGFYFAFSDFLRLYNEDYDDVIPECVESKYAIPDATIQDLSGTAFSSAVISAYDAKQPDWALILVKDCADSALTKQMQDSANSTLTTVYWSTIELANGYTAVLVYSKGLF